MNYESNSSSSPYSNNPTESPKCKIVMMANLSSNFNNQKNISPIILKDKINDSTQSQSDSSYRYYYTTNYYEETNNNEVPFKRTQSKKIGIVDNNKAIQQIFKIFLCYINSLNKNWEQKYNQMNKNLLKEIIYLKKQKDLLIKENSNIKHKLIDIIDNIKKYSNIFSIYDLKYEKLSSQLIKENQYLRNILSKSSPMFSCKYLYYPFNKINFDEKFTQLQFENSFQTFRKQNQQISHLKKKSYDYQPNSNSSMNKNNIRYNSSEENSFDNLNENEKIMSEDYNCFNTINFSK